VRVDVDAAADDGHGPGDGQQHDGRPSQGTHPHGQLVLRVGAQAAAGYRGGGEEGLRGGDLGIRERGGKGWEDEGTYEQATMAPSGTALQHRGTRMGAVRQCVHQCVPF
jgi:hypothetical protein